MGDYLYKKLKPNAKQVNMSINNLEVVKGLVANNNTESHQFIQVSLTTTDIDSRVAELTWYNVDLSGTVLEPFATATLLYGDATEWLASWIPTTHLIQARIQDLERLAQSSVANRFNHSMAYLLFANNLVDYATKYRGMHSVVQYELEAFADVVLSTEKGGSWTVPPYFIDSVAHLAGFVMNVSDAMDTKNNFCVTPGWGSMRFAKPLVPGGKYRSYVKMIPTEEDPSVYLGDVYILQDGIIIGMVGAIKFRRYPRILLSRFFSAPDDPKAPPIAVSSSAKIIPITVHASNPSKHAAAKVEAPKPATPKVATETSSPGANTLPTLNDDNKTPVINGITPTATSGLATDADANTTTAKALQLISTESAIDLADLTDDASFANLGIDSLMSLVIAEKFREQLGVVIGGSLFLMYPTIGDLRSWLEEYYG